MVGGSPTRLPGIALAFLLAATLHAQEHVRWIADLGDPQASEAAERALLGLGEKASKPLQDLLETWDTATPREVERLRAALRVVDLLGEAAIAVAPALTAIAKRNQRPLLLEVLATRAALYPYASDSPWAELFHHGFHSVGEEGKAQALQTFVCMSARSNLRDVGDVATMRKVLEEDSIFAREVAAEALGRLGDLEAIELLRARLLDRDRPPKGWDQVRHNGFVVPIDDQFRQKAAAALVRLAPDDPRSAIGLGCLALLHPHRGVRFESLRSLARFGPDVKAALPELLQIAQQDDAEQAAEAIKVLGMAGREVGLHLAMIESLAVRSHGTVQRMASGLAARLRAMGIVPKTKVVDSAADQSAQELAQAVAALSDLANAAAADAEAKVLAAGTAAWPALVARHRSEQHATPDRVLQLLGRIGQDLPESEREEVRFAMASSQGETWSADSMSTSTGGAEMRHVHREAYARLTMGRPATLEALAEFLSHANAAVRLVAATDLAARRAEIAAPTEPLPAGIQRVRKSLIEAMRAAHPAQSPFECRKNNRQELPTNLDAVIQCAAATALLDCEHLPDARAELLRKILPHEDAAVVALAIERWASPAVEAELTKAKQDPRQQVSKAATTALERLRAPK